MAWPLSVSLFPTMVASRSCNGDGIKSSRYCTPTKVHPSVSRSRPGWYPVAKLDRGPGTAAL